MAVAATSPGEASSTQRSTEVHLVGMSVTLRGRLGLRLGSKAHRGAPCLKLGLRPLRR